MSGKEEFTAEEIANMSPAERQALVDDRTDDEDVLAGGPAGGGPAAGTEGAVVEGEAAAGTEEAGVQDQQTVALAAGAGDDGQPTGTAGATGTEVAGAAGVEGTPGTESKVDRNQPFVSIHPTTHTIVEIDAALKELSQQFEQGDLDMVAYLDQRDSLRDERKDIQHNANSQKQLWQHEQSLFYDTNPQFHPKDGNPVLHGAIKHVFDQLEKDPANASKTGFQLLNEAKKQVHEQLAKVDVRTPAPQPKGGAGNGGAPHPRTLDGSHSAVASAQLPTTLGGLPAAQEADTGKNEFDQLDGLTGIEYEKALTKLSPDQQKRYLEGS
jgi:hypothetical protein